MVPLPVEPDVLEGREPDPRWQGWSAAMRQRRVPLLLAGGGLTLAVAAGFLAARDVDGPAARGAEARSVVDASGVMVVEVASASEADRPRLSGSIRVILPERHLLGFAELEVSVDLASDEELWTSDASGRVHATFDWTTCDGPVAWHFAPEPQASGGAMSLRCDDGSLFAAAVSRDRSVDPSTSHGYQVWLALQDGSYLAG